MKVLLDSTVLIDLLRANVEAQKRIVELRDEGAVFFTSSVNMYEVKCGLTNARKTPSNPEAALAAIQSELIMLNLDEEAAGRAAEVHGQLRSIGKPIDGLDYLVAGIAVSNGIEAVLTRNRKHFENIKEIKQVLTY